MSGADGVKAKVTEAVDRLADDLEKLSHQLHDHPELAFKEEKAHAWLTDFLAKHGATVERGVGGLSTAFRATIPGASAGPTIAIMAEYDALPGIGHACGHNVIATAGVGAGIGLGSDYLGHDEVTLCAFGDGASNHRRFQLESVAVGGWD